MADLLVRTEMEFSGQGNGWTNVTGEIAQRDPLQLERGIRGSSFVDRIASTGMLTFSMFNCPTGSSPSRPLGYYSPGHANQRSGFDKGTGVRVTLRVGLDGYIVEAGVNDKLDFKEAAAQRTATIALGTYASGAAAATAVQTAMNNAAVNNTYAVTYNQSDKLITITRATGETEFWLNWRTGPSWQTTCGSLLGYIIIPDSTYSGPGVSGADLDGTQDYFLRTSDLVGNVDSKKGILSVWVRLDGGDGTLMYIITNTSQRFYLVRTSTNKFQIVGYDTTPTEVLNIRSYNTYTANGQWVHILAAWDLSTGSTALWINGDSDKEEITADNVNIDYTQTNWSIGSNTVAGAKFNGAISELYFAPDQYLDFLYAAQRRKFFEDWGAPVSLGSDGSTPTGTAPLVFCDDGDAEDNKGTGGDFVKSGGPVDSIDGPGWEFTADDHYEGPGEECRDFSGIGSDYYSRASDLTGNANGQTGIFSAWIRIDGGAGTLRTILHSIGSASLIYITTSEELRIRFENGAGDILDIKSSALSLNTWYHVLASWDLANNISHLYISGTSDQTVSVRDDNTIDYTKSSWAIGAYTSGGNKLHGRLSEVYFAPNQYLDFSVEANRQKFYTDVNMPMDLGADGSDPTGTAPIIYLPNGDGTDNQGTGGNFVKSGNPAVKYGPGFHYEADRVSPLNEYIQFIGRIASIVPEPGEYGGRTVQVTAVDYMDMLARKRLTGLALEQDIGDDEVFDKIIDEMQIQPRGRETQEGFDTLPTAFDNMQDERAAPMSELQRLAFSSLAYIYVDREGNLVYENRRQRSLINATNVLEVDASDLPYGNTLDVTDSQEDIINFAQTIIHPRRIDTSTVVMYQAQEAIRVEPGIEFKIRGLYTDPDQRDSRVGGSSMVNPVPTTDYLLNTDEDGGGSDITGLCSVSANFGANSVDLTISHTHLGAAWLTKLQVRGKGVYDQEQLVAEAEDETSIQSYGEYAVSLDMPYQSDASLGLETAQYMIHLAKQGFRHVKRLDIMLDRLTDERARVFAVRKISDRIGITESVTALPTSGYNTGFHINAVAMVKNPDDTVWLSYILVSADATQYWYLEVIGKSELDQTTRLGFGLVVGHTDVAHGDSHDDAVYQDTAHSDVQFCDESHADAGHGDTAHSDVAHTDVSHCDDHDDDPHEDHSHKDSHTDVAFVDDHGDVSHGDVSHVDWHQDFDDLI